MTPEDFARWRKLMGLSKLKAAEALGISRNMPAKYESGEREAPLTVALACAALLRGVKPWPE